MGCSVALLSFALGSLIHPSLTSSEELNKPLLVLPLLAFSVSHETITEQSTLDCFQLLLFPYKFFFLINITLFFLQFEKLWVEIITCLQPHYTGPFDSQLLQELSPLLCIMFTNKSKQIRNQTAQFWNATFGKATTLTYSEELK